MSISGIGIANSYLYKSVNKSNNRENGTALFDWAGRPTASEPQKCQNNRFSVNDAYNSMRMNGKFRSEIGEHYLQGFNTNDRREYFIFIPLERVLIFFFGSRENISIYRLKSCSDHSSRQTLVQYNEYLKIE